MGRSKRAARAAVEIDNVKLPPAVQPNDQVDGSAEESDDEVVQPSNSAFGALAAVRVAWQVDKTRLLGVCSSM